MVTPNIPDITSELAGSSAALVLRCHLFFLFLLSDLSLVIFLIIIFLIVNLEVAQLVSILRAGNHPQPIHQIVLLQVLLGQILQIPLGVRDICTEGEFVPLSVNAHIVTKVVGLAMHLYTLVEELFKAATV